MQSSTFSHHNRELDLLVMVMIGGVNSLIMRTTCFCDCTSKLHTIITQFPLNAQRKKCVCLWCVRRCLLQATAYDMTDVISIPAWIADLLAAFTSIVVCAVCVCVFRFD